MKMEYQEFEFDDIADIVMDGKTEMAESLAEARRWNALDDKPVKKKSDNGILLSLKRV